MLNAKFVVPVIGRIRADISKFSLGNNRCSSCVTCKKPQDTKRTSVSSKCNEYRDKLARCPKAARSNKWQCSQPRQECKVKSVVDDYRKVDQDLTNHAKSILNDFQNRSRSILVQLKKNIEVSKNIEEKQLNELSHGIKKKVQKLLVLDPSFGSCKRKSTLLLDHQTRQALNNLQCDVLPRLNRVQNIVDNLERDLLTRIDRAKSLILSCRKCKNPEALERCIEENAKYAEKILDKTSQNVEFGLKKIEKAQDEILDHHKAKMVELMRTYHEKNKALSEHLDDCIFAANNKGKR